MGVTDIIHLAAESHVDRSIKDPTLFAETNVIGTLNLLNVAKNHWSEDYSAHRFHHVSTDEVYGALNANPENKFKESTPYNPHSPYSAAKASSDHFVRAFHDTFGLNITISNCSNNYGPNQFPEKLRDLVINNILEGKDIPVYGDGLNVRDWLYVEDHAEAIDVIFHRGRSGETYNIGGNHEMTNIDIIRTIIKEIANIKYVEFGRKSNKALKKKPESEWMLNEVAYYTNLLVEKYTSLIKFVKNREGHDFRYAIDCSKLQRQLGWSPKETFKTGIKKTVQWYLDNKEWCDHVKKGEYKKWIKKNYDER